MGINLSSLEKRLEKLEVMGEGPESHVIIVSFGDGAVGDYIESGGVVFHRIVGEDDSAFRGRVILTRQSTQQCSPIVLIPREAQ
jgi:hypothetical protein